MHCFALPWIVLHRAIIYYFKFVNLFSGHCFVCVALLSFVSLRWVEGLASHVTISDVWVARRRVSHVTVSEVWGGKGKGVTCYGFWGLGGREKVSPVMVSEVWGSKKKDVTCYGFLGLG